MEKWEDIKVLFKNRQKWKEPERLFIDYTPDFGEYVFLESKTGVKISQAIETEANLGGWHPYRDAKGSVILVSHNVTKFELNLYGEEGWKNSEDLLNESMKACYSNKNLGTIGASLTKEICENIHGSWKDCWLANKTTKKDKDSRSYMVDMVLHGEICESTLYYKNSNPPHLYPMSLHPIITLPLNILVDIGNSENDGSTPEKALKIKSKTEISPKAIKVTQREEQLAEAKALVEQIEEKTNRLKEIINNLK